MTCLKCKTEMIIDEWEGWVWYCPHCDYEGEKATDKEIQNYEKEWNLNAPKSKYKTQ